MRRVGGRPASINARDETGSGPGGAGGDRRGTGGAVKTTQAGGRRQKRGNRNKTEERRERDENRELSAVHACVK